MTGAPCRYCGAPTYVADFEGPLHPCCGRAFDAGNTYCLSCHRAIAAPGSLPAPGAPMPGKVGRDHPGTARRAAGLVAPRAGSQRSIILDRLLGCYPDGLTAFELSPLLGRSPNQTATRLLELREQGWVEYLEVDGRPVERDTTPGNTGLVQRLSPAGLADLRK